MPGGTESALWKLMRGKGLPGNWERVENRVGTGTPDLAFCFLHDHDPVQGWIELKAIPKLTRKDMIVVPHFTKEQVAWARNWTRSGGFAGLFLRVDRPRHYYLLPQNQAHHLVGGSPASEAWARDISLAHFGSRFYPKRLVEGLVRGTRANRF
jgi:hypothetical protein